MKRKVILISGVGGTAFNKIDVDTFASKLSLLDYVDLNVIGDGETEIKIDDIINSINSIDSDQEVTLIIQSHGNIENGFNFLLGDNFKISSNNLFQIIRTIIGDKPIDVFTQACHGGGMLLDKDVLPSGSTLVSLSSAESVNVGIDYKNMINNFDNFTEEPTSYNLLQFYLSNFLKNRFNPCIAVSGNEKIYNLNDYLKNGQAKNIVFDEGHFNWLGKNHQYIEVSKKLANLNSEYDIYANEYGLAMSICLNDLNNKGLLKEPNYVQNKII